MNEDIEKLRRALHEHGDAVRHEMTTWDLADIMHQELPALLDELEKLRSEHGITEQAKQRDAALAALRKLMDVQNGCPLPKYEIEWTAAMAEAEKLLQEHGR